jgi:hypothetical protein
MTMRRVLAGLIASPLLAGCYMTLPLADSRPEPALGAQLVVELTDQARVGLAPQLGSEVASVEGALVQRTDSQFVLGVSRVFGLWGAQSRWGGERVTFATDQVRRMSIRRFSTGRTAIAAGGVTAAVLAFVLTRSLIGGGSEPTDLNRPPPGNDH